VPFLSLACWKSNSSISKLPSQRVAGANIPKG
jgi:hypothetical protein